MRKKTTMVRTLLLTCVAASVLSFNAAAQNDTRASRIVGGVIALENELNWQVSLESDSQPFCGGSIIGASWILTAAHCVEDANPVQPNLQVRIGTTDLGSGGGDVIAVANVFVHAGYAQGQATDVALLKLANPIGTSGAIVPLANEVTMSTSGAPGSMALVSGWGVTAENGEPSDDLLKVIVPLVSNEVCNGPNSYNGSVTDTEICAGYAKGGKDSCQGDSGGPLVIMHDGKWVQAGVVSYGEGCAQPDKYGVYARVASFTGWINQVMTNGSTPDGGTGGGTGGTGTGTGTGTGAAGGVTLGEYQQLSGLSGTQGSPVTLFTVNVPIDANLLYVSLRGGSGDVDLSVTANQPSNVDDDFDMPAQGSYNEGNNELVFVPFPSAGEWQIQLEAYMDYQGVEMVLFVD